MNKELVYSAKDGYNMVAQHYDDWKWQKFWHLNEYPIIEKWNEQLSSGEGLDAGTGSGNNLDCFLKNGHKVTAIDISIEMLKLCSIKYADFVNNGQLNCQELDIQALLSHSEKYDWIICNRVISHISNLNSVFSVFSKILKRKGQCLISDIHPMHNYVNTSLSIANEKVYIETYKHSITSLKSSLKKYNFEIVEFKEVGVENLENKEIIDDFIGLSLQTTPIFYYLIIRLK